MVQCTHCFVNLSDRRCCRPVAFCYNCCCSSVGTSLCAFHFNSVAVASQEQILAKDQSAEAGQAMTVLQAHIAAAAQIPPAGGHDGHQEEKSNNLAVIEVQDEPNPAQPEEGWKKALDSFAMLMTTQMAEQAANMAYMSTQILQLSTRPPSLPHGAASVPASLSPQQAASAASIPPPASMVVMPGAAVGAVVQPVSTTEADSLSRR